MQERPQAHHKVSKLAVARHVRRVGIVIDEQRRRQRRPARLGGRLGGAPPRVHHVAPRCHGAVDAAPAAEAPAALSHAHESTQTTQVHVSSGGAKRTRHQSVTSAPHATVQEVGDVHGGHGSVDEVVF